MGAIASKKHTMAADVTNTNTFTTTYPAGTTQATLLASTGGQLVVNGTKHVQGTGVSFSFGASNITVTNSTGATLAAGTEILLSFGKTDRKGGYNPDMNENPVTNLTAATGTASDTIADVGASFTQATLNNNFKSLADKINALNAAIAGLNTQ